MDEMFLVECPRCGELKERTEFRLLPKGERSTFCSTCSSEVRERWWAQNSTDVDARLAAWRAKR